MKRAACLLALSPLLIAPLAAASLPKKPALRFPFSLSDRTTPEEARATLKAKGLGLESEKTLEGELFSYWKMSGQVNHENFTPQRAILTFENNALTSVALSVDGLKDCGVAQPVLNSALDLARTSYDTHYSPVTQEPSTDIIDCGPHFDPGNYNLRLDSKKMVLTVIPTYRGSQYGVLMSYHVRPTSPKEAPKTRKAFVMPQNL
jgi:hypothetical protein